MLVAPSGSTLASHIGLAELAGYPLILPSAPNAIRSLIEALIRSTHLELRIVAEVGAVPTALSPVEKGIGCSIAP